MIPNEITIFIFSFLSEHDLCFCIRVSKLWFNIIDVYIARRISKYSTFGDFILDCCERNHLLSFDRAINKLNDIFPHINYILLWSQCISITCVKGHFALFKRLQKFAVYNQKELIQLAGDNNHMNIVDFL